MTLVIMAAGMGSRYGGLKQLDPVGPGGEFIIDYSIYDAIRAGFNKVVFIIKEENLEAFKETVSRRIEGKIDIEFVFQKIEKYADGVDIPEARKKPWGTAHAVLCAREAVGDDDFAVINSDDFYGKASFAIIADHLRAAKKGEAKAHFCMSGFKLCNTLTENGHVSRGICETDENGILSVITERTKIQRNNGTIQYFEDDKWFDLSENAIASMNCWGFTKEFFKELEGGIAQFFEENKANLEKCEYYLPSAVKNMISKGLCDVKVLGTDARWYGVTYHEDRQAVVDALNAMIAAGEYPERLWN